MIYSPVTTTLLLLFGLLLGVLVLLVELRVLAYAYRKIGVRPRYVLAVLLLTLIGSHVNIPLYSVSVDRVLPPQAIEMFGRLYLVPEIVQPRTTVVALNVGGALIPALVSAYLLIRTRLYVPMLIGTLVVAVVVNRLAQIVPGVGIAVPMLAPPLVAAGAALLLAFRKAPPVAYVAGSMGALIGADLLNLGRIADLQAPVVAIGGAGTFDGVFLTGIIAGLLA
jgi:uncharacterized membrane protein